MNLEPNANCVRLDEFTEVVVSPKTRTFSQQKRPQQVPVHSGKDITEQRSNQASGTCAGQKRTATTAASNENSQLSSGPSLSSTINSKQQNNIVYRGFLSTFSGYLHTLFYSHGEESSVNENQICESLIPEGSTNNQNWRTFSALAKSGQKCGDDRDLEMYLRVQPEIKANSNMSNKTNISTSVNYYSLQPTVVFVDFASLPPLVLKSWTCKLASFPPPDNTVEKIVQIHRLLSPKERAALQTSRASSNNRENQGSQSQETLAHSESNQGELFVLRLIFSAGDCGNRVVSGVVHVVPGGRRRVLKKHLYGDVLPQRANPYHFIYHFCPKRCILSYTSHRKWYPFSMYMYAYNKFYTSAH